MQPHAIGSSDATQRSLPITRLEHNDLETTRFIPSDLESLEIAVQDLNTAEFCARGFRGENHRLSRPLSVHKIRYPLCDEPIAIYSFTNSEKINC